MADRSFQTLIYSLLLHALLAWWFLGVSSQNEISAQKVPIEFTVHEGGRKQTFVKETEDKEALVEDLKRKADYLSRFTKRVKEQIRAKNSGETKNRTGQDPLESDELAARGNQGQSRDSHRESRLAQGENGPGPKAGDQEGANPFGHNVVVGASTSGEYIPNVKVGSFTALNTDRFTYYTFFARINEQVRSRWIRNLRVLSDSLSSNEHNLLALRERITEVDIQLDGTGNFVRAVLLHSSGSDALDEAAKSAFHEAAPFTNPPQRMIESDGLIHLRYGFVVQWMPTSFHRSE